MSNKILFQLEKIKHNSFTIIMNTKMLEKKIKKPQHCYAVPVWSKDEMEQGTKTLRCGLFGCWLDRQWSQKINIDVFSCII